MQTLWKLITGLLLVAGCSQGDEKKVPEPYQRVPVRLEIGYESGLDTRALEDGTQNVTRISVLFFQKINESGSNTDSTNFTLIPAYTIRQDVGSFPVQVSQTIDAAHTYRAFIVGYSQADYGNGTDRFSFAGLSGGQTLSQHAVLLNAANKVPQFFITACSAVQGATNLGTAFKPTTGDPVRLKAVLKRAVCGISLSITNIPAYVKTISLRAGSLATSMKIVDFTSQGLVNSGNAMTLATLTPVSGSVLFENLILPVWKGNTTKLYLDVAYGSTTETYQVKVNNSTVSSDHNFTFSPNRIIKITGTYDRINLGFLVNSNINLDDNNWDGLH